MPLSLHSRYYDDTSDEESQAAEVLEVMSSTEEEFGVAISYPPGAAPELTPTSSLVDRAIGVSDERKRKFEEGPKEDEKAFVKKTPACTGGWTSGKIWRGAHHDPEGVLRHGGPTTVSSIMEFQKRYCK